MAEEKVNPSLCTHERLYLINETVGIENDLHTIARCSECHTAITVFSLIPSRIETALAEIAKDISRLKQLLP